MLDFCRLGCVRRFSAVALFSALAVWFGSQQSTTALRVTIASAAEEPKAKADRKPWTTSRVTGSPEPPPPYKAVRVFPNLKFEHPLLMARAPGMDRLFVGEQAGVLYSFPNKPDAKAELFIDLRKELKTLQLNPRAKDVESVYGLVFHPQFEKNRQCFICYTMHSKEKGNLADGTRVSRFTVTRTDPPRADPASEEVVFTYPQGGHNGGDIHFGPDGMLYISTGDGVGPNPPDTLNTGQDISDLLSSILRIDVDRKDEGRSYAVPRDNPFISMKGARPEIWAYGFRNPWRMSFDRRTGSLFVGDVGWELWEMIYRVEKGGNYGWSAMEGPQPIKPDKVGPTPILPPLIALPHTVAASVTGGYVYHGKKFPELQGAYVFGDWETRRMWAARFDGERVKEMPELTRPSVRIVAFGEDSAGELYFLDYDGGTVHTLERNDKSAKNNDFPTRLSETGLFVSVKDSVPATGVVPFAINARQWQDGATAEHWAAFPNASSATLYQKGKPIPGNVDWHNFRVHFPKDATLVKTIALHGKRIETQLLHFDGVDWRGYSFAWRDDQSDADIVPADGAEKELPGEKHARVWQFHSRSQCLSCHSSWSEYALGFQPAQLNRTGSDGRNQLIALTENGMMTRVDDKGKKLPPFDAAAAAKEAPLADPADASKPVKDRARAYLHANCGHCHREHGGGAVLIRLDAGSDQTEMRALGIPPMRGDFGLPDARIIKPGDPCASTLFYRMAKFGRDRMPHLGAELPDEFGMKLVAEWISELGKEPITHVVDLNAPEKILADPSAAILAARQMGRGEMKPADRDRLLAAVAKLPPCPTRELFEGYLLEGDKVERKLGSNPRPRSILALKGVAARGEKLFWSKTINCGSCHKIGERGTTIGPDLSSIARQRTREDLLESILEPSRRIEPKFAAYTARLQDGRSLTGMLVQRDEKQVVLRDALDKLHTFAAADIEVVRPSRLSLMPDGQLANLTTQEAADLLEYLAARK
jgi:putative heme-binding domain-containing protein